MNEQLQGKLVEILSGIQTATKAAGDFAMEQLPDIAQSYVMYGRVTSLVSLVMALALVSGSIYLMFKIIKHIQKAGDMLDAEPAFVVPGGIGSAFGMVIGFAWLKDSAFMAALVWFAPKVWLLKELAGLIK